MQVFKNKRGIMACELGPVFHLVQTIEYDCVHLVLIKIVRHLISDFLVTVNEKDRGTRQFSGDFFNIHWLIQERKLPVNSKLGILTLAAMD
jgi:hypothetical protein